MLRRVRETAPAGLVPLAWLFAGAAHFELLVARSVLIGHLVMTGLLVAFAALSHREMRTHPVLRAWLAVIVMGVGVTSLGAYGVASDRALFARLAVGGWMALPGIALGYTGHVLPADEHARLYAVGAVLCGAGTVLLLGGAVGPALVTAGIGQTLGILVATLEY
jgi:hypothetical protein